MKKSTHSPLHLILRESIIMKVFFILFSFNFLLLVSFLGEANNINAVKLESEDKVYIVYMGKKSLVDGAPRSDHTQLMSELQKREKNNHILHTYNKSFMGFVARLSEEEANEIAERPGVVSVFPDQVAHPQTTRSWGFLKSQINVAFQTSDSATSTHSDQVSPSTGADIIIGIMDFGIWPEHPSFSDDNMGPIPSSWKGICMSGQEFTCNRKLVGARYYDDPEEVGYMVSARDETGHGTHVASTAAGRYVAQASYYGLAKGTARGGSSGSRIAVYRVCGRDNNCMGSAILKAYDDAIADGVDVLSISISWHEHFFLNPIIVGAFHAVEKGILVVCSAGNKGPSPGSVSNVAPWILTVGATSIDRAFVAGIVLGDGEFIEGGGINFSRLKTFAAYKLVDGGSAGTKQANVFDAINCVPGSLDDDRVKGKIVLCENNVNERDFGSLKRQGAIGMILISNKQAQDPYNYGTFAVAAVNGEDGARIRYYIHSTSNALATILPTRTVIRSDKPAPVVPRFSSRGPISSQDLFQNLIKPDVAAPGVGILAAWPPLNDSSWAFPGKETPLFNIISGTSMSCPHVSGLAATVKSRHPTWTPDVIRSAIMTTATQTNNLNDQITTSTGSTATPYDIGAGEISVSGPLRPGLVYETTDADYLRFLCNMGYTTSKVKTISSTAPRNFSCPRKWSSDWISDMNYPSIAVFVSEENGGRTVTRTLTNVGEKYSTYTVDVEAPDSLDVQVVPNVLRFTKTAKKLSFQVTFMRTTNSQQDLFGSIIWSSNNNKVRSPFVVRSA